MCAAFNADFDGDQMAVHVPLSYAAVKEAREMMLSINNMLLPSCGEPVVTPTLDMVFGCYYLTTIKSGARGEGARLSSFEEAKLSYELGAIELRAEIEVRVEEGKMAKTSVGRIIFNEILPPGLGFINKDIDKSSLKRIVADCYKKLGNEPAMCKMLDALKDLGFKYATKSGITIAMSDIEVPVDKPRLIEKADEKTAIVESQYQRGLITDDERYNSVIEVWMDTTDDITQAIQKSMNKNGSVYMMANSGAKGNISQIRQMAGIRGLMTNPSGKIIDFPIKSSLREGLSAIEYFISTHGARKGLADTALRTSGSGYLTRRLVDVTQDVIIREYDCGTTDGVWITEPEEMDILPPFAERMTGRMAATQVINPQTGEIIIDRNQEIDELTAKTIVEAGIKSVYVRSPLSCQLKQGLCQLCYGRDLARGRMVELSTAVGIIAAQSIGEPGTQLTLRTFHTGGVVGLDELDITTGLPRVEELFEARIPKTQAIISEIDGVAEVINNEEGKRIKVVSYDVFNDEYKVPEGWQLLVSHGQWVDAGNVIAAPPQDSNQTFAELIVNNLTARSSGDVIIQDGKLFVKVEEKEEREYVVPVAIHIRIQDGDMVKAGQQLTDGSINPHDILMVLGKEAVERYLVDEVQKVYCSQGVHINDRHIEVIVRQMLSKVRIDSPGDSDIVPRELVDRFRYEEINAKVLAEGGEPATAHAVLMGITRASLSTDSWLAAASFQETTRVLTEAAVCGKLDRLSGLKENVIIGKLIPARCRASKEASAEMEHRLAQKETPHMLADFDKEESSLSLSEDVSEQGNGESLSNDDNDEEKSES
jgi:DNA-directed RNA polymerase subunit beta'